MVRAGRVRPRTDDGEVHPLVALRQQPPADLGRDLGLGAPDERDLSVLERLGHAVGGGTGPGQHLDLGRVLHGPEGRGDRRRPQVAGGGAVGLEVEHEPGPRAVVDGDGGGRTHQPGHQVERVLGLGPRAHRELAGPLDHPGRLQPGDDQHGFTVAGHHQHGEPFEGHGLVADEPRQVGSYRQQQHVDLTLGHGVTNPGQARTGHGGRLPAGPRADTGRRNVRYPGAKMPNLLVGAGLVVGQLERRPRARGE